MHFYGNNHILLPYPFANNQSVVSLPSALENGIDKLRGCLT